MEEVKQKKISKSCKLENLFDFEAGTAENASAIDTTVKF